MLQAKPGQTLFYPPTQYLTTIKTPNTTRAHTTPGNSVGKEQEN